MSRDDIQKGTYPAYEDYEDCILKHVKDPSPNVCYHANLFKVPKDTIYREIEDCKKKLKYVDKDSD